MNRRLVIRLLGSIMMMEAVCMLPSLLVALHFGDGDALSFVYAIVLLAALGVPMRCLSKPRETDLRAREGILVVALGWLALPAFGALPFLFSGVIPNYIDAFFEAVSGFTTTGSSIMPVVEGQPHGIMFWRSFTHWIGGMGVLVLTLAILPKMSGRTSHLVRAESPGPTLSKVLPRMGDTAKVLYIIYAVLTVVMFLCLLPTGISLYDNALHTLGTAGTGGFSNYAASVGAFNNPAVEIIITIFMLIFGVNFAIYYKVITDGPREGLRNEELRWFLSIYAAVTLLVTLTILPQCEGTFLTALRQGAFQVATIISTTGYATTDFNLWPIAAKMLLLIVMFTGSCAGSTAGGIKICRIGMMCKQSLREVRRVFSPRKVQVVRFEGKAVDESVLRQVAVFIFVYFLIFLFCAIAISFDSSFDMETNLTASLTCISNVGPGLGAVGPAGNFSGYGPFAKILLSLEMLLGRLEIFPLLALFHPAIWKR